MTPSVIHEEARGDWGTMNEAFNALATQRVRLLLKHHIDHLRPQWAADPLHGHGPSVVSDEQANVLLAETAMHPNGATPRDESLHALDQRINELRERMGRQGEHPALDLLARRFALDAFEQDVLAICLAPETDPGFHRLYAYAQDDPQAHHPTPHLAATLLGEHGGWARFLPLAPLRHHGLVDVGPQDGLLATRPLSLTTRTLAFLRGVDHPDEDAARILRPLHAAPLTPALRELSQRLAGHLSAQAGPWPVVNLVGPAGSGRRALAHHLCAALGIHAALLEPDRLPTAPAERRDALRSVRRETVMATVASCIPAPDRTTAQAGIDDIVEALPGFLIVVSGSPWRSDRSTLTLHVPSMDATGQEDLWLQALGDADAATARDLAQQFLLSPSDIPRVVDAARQHARLRDPASRDVPAHALWQAARAHTGGSFGRLAQRIEPVHEWDDLVLPGDAESTLREIADQAAHRHRVYESWGFGKRLNRGRGISVLFAGPSGTGKTLAAEIVAGHLGIELHRVNLANTVSKYIGETEKNLQEVFDAAECSGAVVFFDEADALFGKRTEVRDSHDRYANLEVDYLLQRMEEYRGLAILASNRKEDLDKAFLRRLRFIIDFPRPGRRERLRIWERAFPPATPTQGVDLEALANLDTTGGSIRNIALNAAFLAAASGGPVTMAHVMHAARREYEKLGQRTTELEFGQYHREERAA